VKNFFFATGRNPDIMCTRDLTILSARHFSDQVVTGPGRGVVDVSEGAVVIVIGDVVPHGVLGSNEFWNANGLALVRCSEEPVGVLSLCGKLRPAFLVVNQSFIEALSEPDVALMIGSGQNTRVLILLQQDSPETAKRMVQRGCHGVLPPKFSCKMLRRAIPAMMGGELWVPRRVLSEMVFQLRQAPPQKEASSLTPREEHILELVRLGYKNSEIAATLFISHETVRWHKRRLYRKLGPARLPKIQTPRRPPVSLPSTQPSNPLSLGS
jgi:DNA-binding NarL/FixJ family response regulator